MRAFYFWAIITVLAGLIIAVNSCGGGGDDSPASGGDDSPASEITLSSSQAQPGQFITVYHDSIQDGSTVEITFKGAAGYEVRAETELTTAGQAKIAVPVHYDAEDARFGGGNLTVSVEGISMPASLEVTGLPELQEGMRGGDLAVFIMRASIDEYTGLLDNIQTMAEETGGEVNETQAVSSILARISALQDMIWEIETFGELTVETQEGQTVLSTEDLETVDRILLASIMGMSDALGFTDALASSGTPVLPASPLDGVPQHIKDRIEHVIAETKRGLEGGDMLLGGTSILVVVGGVVLNAPVVAAAGGIALVYVTVTYDFGSSAIGEKLTDGFVEKSGEAVDYGKKAVKSLIRIGTEFVSAGGSKLAKALAMALAVLQDARDVHESAEKVVCEDVPVHEQILMKTADNCGPGYVWSPYFGGCVQENCNDIPDAHYSYTGYCVCGSSGSIYEDPADPNKECSLPWDDASCPGCVYACVHFDEECPGTSPVPNPELIEFCRIVLAPQ